MATSENTQAFRAPLTQADYSAKLSPGASITSSDVATLPRPGTSAPSSLKFNQDGKFVTYLSAEPGALSRRLLATEVATGKTLELLNPEGAGEEKDFSLEEKLRRERARMMATGVTSYAWANGVKRSSGSEPQQQQQRMLVPLGGALWVLDSPLDGFGSSGAVTKDAPEPRKVAETRAAAGAALAEGVCEEGFDALPAGAPLLDAKLSADGSTVAFVCGNEVYAVDVDASAGSAGSAGSPRRLTSGARGVEGLSNGVSDYVAQEELERADGFWLSPRGGLVAFESADERHIPAYRITHQGESSGLSPTAQELETAGAGGGKPWAEPSVTFEEHRYPFAGARNPAVKLGVVAAKANAPRDVQWFDLAQVFGEDFYLAKVEWLPPVDAAQDSTRLAVQLLDRRQKKLALVLLDTATPTPAPNSGEAGALKPVQVLHVEQAPEYGWINLNDAFRVLKQAPADDGGLKLEFLWASERDGWRHLYVLEADTSPPSPPSSDGAARVVRRLTGPGDFMVEEVLAVGGEGGEGGDEEEFVYFMGTAEGAWLERHLFRVPLNPPSSSSQAGSSGAPECLTSGSPGTHHCAVSLASQSMVDTVSAAAQPPITTVRRLPKGTAKGGAAKGGGAKGGEVLVALHDCSGDPKVATLGPAALRAPTFHTLPSTDGQVTLQAAVYKPDESLWGAGPWPVVVACYGGPHVQYVAESWAMTVDLRSQFLRAQGFLVLKVDNRGSARRGLVFEAPIRGRMGEVEVADQVAGVEWAAAQGLADPKRVAVSGWSYGGYMALKCLAGRPDVFHSAVSGAPVTDWALYDTAYTERYMGLPQENPSGYASSSVLGHVSAIEGSLLLCHGLLDENVLFRHSAVLVNALVEHRKAHDLALFPSERHGPRRPQDRAFLEERILAFLQRTLGVA